MVRARSLFDRQRPVRSIAMTVAVLVAVGGLGVAASRVVREDTGNRASGLCALLPDAVGLYVGNPITQMGYQIGTVDKITTDDTQVRVDFSLDASRRIPADVKAVIRSTSILADRSLELVGNYQSGPELEPDGCVPLARSSTPKSISEVVGSAADFIRGITPAQSSNIADALSGLDQLMRGRGGDINTVLTTTSSLLDSPDQSISDIGVIITSLAQLTAMINDHTGPLKQIITALPATTHNVSDALSGTDDLIDALPRIITLVDDLERRLGNETQQVLDILPAAIHLAATRSDDAAAFLDPLPGLVGLIGESSRTGRGFDVMYRPPAYRIDTPNAAATCDTLNAAMPGSCDIVAGHPQATDVSLLQLVLAGSAR